MTGKINVKKFYEYNQSININEIIKIINNFYEINDFYYVDKTVNILGVYIGKNIDLIFNYIFDD